MSTKSLTALLAKTDALVQHTLRLLAHPNGSSSLLLTLQYTLTLLHARLLALLTARYERLALSIASKASETMLPGEALVATIEPPYLGLREWCVSVDNARRTVEDVRCAHRLVGLLRVYGRGRRLREEGRRDPAVKVLEWGKFGARAAWLGCENLGFLVRRGVVRGEKWEGRERGLMVWSWRIYAAELVLEGLRLWRVKQMRFDEDLGAQKLQKQEEGAVSVQSKELEQRWWRDVYTTIGWIPATMQYGFGDEENVGEAWAGFGGMVSGFVGLKEAWRETA